MTWRVLNHEPPIVVDLRSVSVYRQWQVTSKMWPFRSSAPIVPVLRLSGVISPTAQPFRGALNLADLAGPIQHAFALRGARAVALAINSPGGSPVQSTLIGKRIRALAREKDLPVFAFVEDVAASGGYWLACAGDEIFAESTSIVGSIGVISASFGFTEALKKVGVERRIYAQGAHKALLDPFSPAKDEDVARLESIQKDIFESFKQHVRDRRGRRLKADDDALFNGDIWTGTQAQQLGLVDGIGDMRTILRERFGDKVKLKLVQASRGWIRRRLRMTAPDDFAGGTPDLISGVVAALEARAVWARFGL